eukprot:TRINITY_DN161_c0_g1_i4.p2 TRINITY_DN161_c0_g1~~TRINITY_DN161_c0_g1_i4.p2  ORF type:complete len:167 (+),score=24.84 TRINITY_DN161_c0_g1_i4:49-549(+)
MRHTQLIVALSFVAACIFAVPLEMKPQEDLACPSNPLRPGRYTYTVTFGGVQRNYILYVPARYDNTRALPLFFAFHGLSNNADQAYVNFGIPEISDAQNVISVVPNGYGQSWNGGDCCPPATRDGIDDIGFVRFLVTEVSKKVSFNRKKIIIINMTQNPGFKVYRH